MKNILKKTSFIVKVFSKLKQYHIQILEFVLHLSFWIILLYFFERYSLLRPGCFRHPYKEDIAVVIVFFLVYINTFIYFNYLYRKNKRFLYWGCTVITVLISAYIEFLMVKVDILSCLHIPGLNIKVFLFPLTLRNAGILSFFILLRFYKESLFQKRQLVKMFEIERLYLSSRVAPHYFSNVILSMQNLLQNSRKEEFGKQLSKLDHVIHYMLVDAIKKEVTLKDELHFYANYIELEKLRHAANIDFKMEVDVEDFMIYIPPLLFENLICNAFKFCPHDGSGYVKICITQPDKTQIKFVIENNISSSVINRKDSGQGIPNLRNRLELCCKEQYQLYFEKEEQVYRAVLTLKIK